MYLMKILKPYPRFAVLLIVWGVQMFLLVRGFHVTKGTMGLVMGIEATLLWFLLSYVYSFGKGRV